MVRLPTFEKFLDEQEISHRTGEMIKKVFSKYIDDNHGYVDPEEKAAIIAACVSLGMDDGLKELKSKLK